MANQAKPADDRLLNFQSLGEGKNKKRTEPKTVRSELDNFDFNVSADQGQKRHPDRLKG